MWSLKAWGQGSGAPVYRQVVQRPTGTHIGEGCEARIANLVDVEPQNSEGWERPTGTSRSERRETDVPDLVRGQFEVFKSWERPPGQKREHLPAGIIANSCISESERFEVGAQVQASTQTPSVFDAERLHSVQRKLLDATELIHAHLSKELLNRLLVRAVGKGFGLNERVEVVGANGPVARLHRILRAQVEDELPLCFKEEELLNLLRRAPLIGGPPRVCVRDFARRVLGQLGEHVDCRALVRIPAEEGRHDEALSLFKEVEKKAVKDHAPQGSAESAWP